MTDEGHVATLDDYQRKRDFAETSEPGPDLKSSPGGNLFVIQKHAARRLHYDFRLELDGVLKSWAVPKGPSLDPAQKHLAVHVEDHPLDYAGFEGTIPQGQYGGGTVMIWDRGRWYPAGESVDDPRAAYEAGRLKFHLEGEKLRGHWMLLRLKPKPGEHADNWLLFKERDEEARAGDDAAITVSRPLSAATGRSLEEIAAHTTVTTGADAPGSDLDRLPGAVPAGMPTSVSPELATRVPSPPRGDDWLHEIKYDGYRVVCRFENGSALLLTRSTADWTERFPLLGGVLRGLQARSAILDGEVVFVQPDGHTSFAQLAGALQRAEANDARIVYYVFDLLYLDGYDLTGVRLEDRKVVLRELLEMSRLGSRVRYVDHVSGSGDEFFAQACELALEGSIAKRRDSRYRPGRGRDWQKVKCLGQQEFVVGGFTERAAGGGIGALLVGSHYEPGGPLQFAGRIGTGWDDATMTELRRMLEGSRTGAAPFVDPPRGKNAAGVKWVRPETVIAATYLSWDGRGALRHAAFQGIRLDKLAADVVSEAPSGGERSEHAATEHPAVRRASSAASSAAAVAGVDISHPDRLLYPEAGISKLDVARYYEAVGPAMLPHLRRRALTLVRCPEGHSRVCFYQRHATEYFPAEVLRVPVLDSEGTSVHGAVDSVAGIVSLVQLGVLEFHTWGSHLETLEYPDQLVFDFDPDPALPFGKVIEGARLLHDMLFGLGLRSFVKTTGGKGLHVVAPLEPERTWDEVRPFTRGVAEALVRFAPGTYTTNMSLKQRHGKIYIDHLRNRRGATAICAYSTRRRPGAPVAVPLRWDELRAGMRGDRYTLTSVRRRLSQLEEDPWASYWTCRQRITEAMERSVDISD